MTLNTEHCKLSNQNIMRKIKQLFLKGGKCHRIIELNSTGTSMDGNISFHLKKKITCRKTIMTKDLKIKRIRDVFKSP